MDLICVCLALWLAPLIYLYVWGGWGMQFPLGYLSNPWWQAALLIQLYIFYIADLYDTEGMAQAQRGVLTAARVAMGVGGMVVVFVLIYFFTRRLPKSIPRSRGKAVGCARAIGTADGRGKRNEFCRCPDC